MKNLLFSIAVLWSVFVHGQVVVIGDTATLRYYINQAIVTNGSRSITAQQLSNIFNGLLNVSSHASSVDSIRGVRVDTTGMRDTTRYLYYDKPSSTYKFRKIKLQDVLLALGYAPLTAADTLSLSGRTNAKKNNNDSLGVSGYVTHYQLNKNIDSLGNILDTTLTVSDTTGKWLSDIYKRSDSLFYVKNGLEIFWGIDSSGGAATTASQGIVRIGNDFQLGGNVTTFLNIPIATSHASISLSVLGGGAYPSTIIGTGGQFQFNSDVLNSLPNTISFVDAPSSTYGLGWRVNADGVTKQFGFHTTSNRDFLIFPAGTEDHYGINKTVDNGKGFQDSTTVWIGDTLTLAVTPYIPLDTTAFKLLVKDASGNVLTTDWSVSGGTDSVNNGLSKNGGITQFGQPFPSAGNPAALRSGYTEVPLGDTSALVFTHYDPGAGIFTYTRLGTGYLQLNGSQAANNSSAIFFQDVGGGCSIGIDSLGIFELGYGTNGLKFFANGSNHVAVGNYVDNGRWFQDTGSASFGDTVFLTKSLQVGEHITSTGSGISIAAGTGAGTSPTISITGTDISGVIELTTGTLPTAAATVFTVTYAVPYSNKAIVVLTPANSLAGLLSGGTGVYVDYATSSGSAFPVLAETTALTAATSYKWYYHVIR